MHGKPQAFVTFMTTDQQSEATIGLMRQVPGAPSYTMEFMFTHLALELKARDFKILSLGMAPLAGMARTPLSSRWHRIAGLLWEYGGAIYNFRRIAQLQEQVPSFLGTPLPGGVGSYRSVHQPCRCGSACQQSSPGFFGGMTGPGRALTAIALVCCMGVSPAYAFDVGRYGNVKVVEPKGPARGVVILFSGTRRLSKGDDGAAAAIAEAGALVAEVDSRVYLRRLNKIKEKCHELVYDAEWLSRDLQRTRKFPSYLTPIVAGVGQGGTIAEMILDETPPATIAGAVSLDPAEIVATRRPLCSDVSATARRGGFRYGVPKKLLGFWTVGLTPRSVARIANT